MKAAPITTYRKALRGNKRTVRIGVGDIPNLPARGFGELPWESAHHNGIFRLVGAESGWLLSLLDNMAVWCVGRPIRILGIQLDIARKAL